jgi:hypothetical protein
VYNELFVDEGGGAQELFQKLNILHSDMVDYVSFVDTLKVADIPQLTSKCREVGPLKMVRASSVVLCGLSVCAWPACKGHA